MGWKPSSRAAATAETAAGGGGDAAPAALGAAVAAAVDAGGVVAGAGRGEGVADSGDGAGAAAAEDATAGAWWCAASLRRRREVGGTCAVSVAALLHACSSLCCGTPLLRLRLWLCGARVRGLLSAAVAACIGSGLFVSASVRVCLSLARTHAADEKEVGEATKTREKRGGTIRTEKKQLLGWKHSKKKRLDTTDSPNGTPTHFTQHLLHPHVLVTITKHTPLFVFSYLNVTVWNMRVC